MKRLLYGICLSAIIIQTSAAQPIVSPQSILKNTMSLLYYQRDYLRLSEPFEATDTHGKALSRGMFLQRLAAGGYLPLRLQSKKAQANYQLYTLSSRTDADVKAVLQQTGTQYYKYYKMEGMPLPPFKFTDLQGRIYTNQNTKGKTLVIKCWFVACHACIAEMPQLNELVNHYQNRRDVLFVSIVTDKEPPLKAFAQKNTFRYAMAANQEAYITSKLKVTQYPTHFIINPQGRITQVISNADELAVALKQYTGI